MQHQIDHCDVDHVLAGSWKKFVVFAQAAIAIQPSECSLHNPAQGQDGEPLGRIAAPDNIDRPTGKLLDPGFELPGIASIGPDFFQARTVESDLVDNHLPAVAILYAGRMDDRADDQPQGVDQHVALAPLYLFSRVITALRPPFSVVLTDWLSRIAALGVGSRASASRTFSWSAS